MGHFWVKNFDELLAIVKSIVLEGNWRLQSEVDSRESQIGCARVLDFLPTRQVQIDKLTIWQTLV